jgi:hypothetical protein
LLNGIKNKKVLPFYMNHVSYIKGRHENTDMKIQTFEIGYGI